MSYIFFSSYFHGMSNYFQHSVNNTSEKALFPQKSISALIFAFLKTYCLIEVFNVFFSPLHSPSGEKAIKIDGPNYFSCSITSHWESSISKRKKNNNHQNYDCTNEIEIENFIYLNWKVKINNFLISFSIFLFLFSLWLLKIQIADEQWLQTIYKIIIQNSLDIKVSKKNA